MKKSFELLRTTRANILTIINQASDEQLFAIPPGANNHVFWNFAHTIVTQQLLCYKMSGLEFRVSSDLIDKYRKGTVPGAETPADEISLVKELAVSTANQLQKDYDEGLFVNYNRYETSYGFVLESIEDAITFNNVHEAMHLGQIKEMIKL